MMRKHINVGGTAEAVAGSTSILSLMIRKKLQFAQVSTDVNYYSTRGLGSYKDKKTDIRQICPGISIAMFFFVRANSAIKRPEDMRGKRILVYSPTSAPVTLYADMLLKSIGLTRKDVIAMLIIGQPEGVRALTDGTAEGFIWAGSPLAPVSAFAEMANRQMSG